MFKQTALITLMDKTDGARSALAARLKEFAHDSIIGEGLPQSANGGDLVWHQHFASQGDWLASGAFSFLDRMETESGISRIDAVSYVPKTITLAEPMITNAVYRTLFVQVNAGTPTRRIDQWLQELPAMPAYIPEIRNAALSATIAARGVRNWTHVWEQEFVDVGGLTGPYMSSPYHWAHVDRWFDPEMTEWIIDLQLCHSASTLSRGVIKHYQGTK